MARCPSYRFGEIQAAHSALEGAEADHLQRGQAHRVPHSDMGLQGLRGKHRQVTAGKHRVLPAPQTAG